MRTLKSFTIVVMAVIFTITANAQNTTNEAALIQEAWGMAKKEVIMEYMEMDATESDKFWPVYDSYVVERKELGAERIGIITDYANVYDNMNDVQATDLTKRLFKNNMSIEKLQLKYYKKLSKAVSPLEASKFIQVEKYLDNVVRSELQEDIPFIGEKEDLRL